MQFPSTRSRPLRTSCYCALYCNSSASREHTAHRNPGPIRQRGAGSDRLANPSGALNAAAGRRLLLRMGKRRVLVWLIVSRRARVADSCRLDGAA